MVVITIIPILMGSLTMLFLSIKSGHEALHGALRMEYQGPALISAIRRDLRTTGNIDIKGASLSITRKDQEIGYALKEGQLRRGKRGADGLHKTHDLAAAECFEPRLVSPHRLDLKICLSAEHGQLTHQRQVHAVIALGAHR